MKNAFSLQGCVATRSLATVSVKIETFLQKGLMQY